MKQCLSLLLALCLAFTLAAPALAEATPLEQAPLAPESAPAADSAAAVPEPETGAAPVDLAQAPLAQEALAGEAAAGAAKEGKDASGTQAFVTRLYQTVLDRAPDAAGLATWVNALNGRQMTGAQVAQNMFQSPEYQRRGRTDAQYIDDLYRAMFGRAPDAAGTQTWQDALDNGVSRLFLLAGFAGGSEFAALCRQYGIAQGSVAVTENRDKNYSVTQFVARLYRLCLGRKADTSGLNDWCGWLLSGQQTGASAAAGFVFSAECKNQGLSDTAFVQMLYRAFMDREADASGQRTWTQALADGASREWVFNGFAASKEFANICARYGIQVGQSPVQAVEDLLGPDNADGLPPLNDTLKAFYQKAYELHDMFEFNRFTSGGSTPDLRWYLVTNPGFETFARMEAQVRQYFAGQEAADMMDPWYWCEINGRLYHVNADRGSIHGYSGHTWEVKEVTTSKIVLEATAYYLNDSSHWNGFHYTKPPASEMYKYRTLQWDFILEQTADGWRFTKMDSFL